MEPNDLLRDREYRLVMREVRAEIAEAWNTYRSAAYTRRGWSALREVGRMALWIVASAAYARERLRKPTT